MAVLPFQIGDTFLVQRLGRQSAKVNTIQALLQPQPALWTAIKSYITTAVTASGTLLFVSWDGANVATYILRQHQNTLVHAGFIQVQKRPERPESDIVLLAPALDTPSGHPIIWEKLLTYYTHKAADQRISRIYADLPDQPLPIHTFNTVGFKCYTRETIWRLPSHLVESFAYLPSATIRPQVTQDTWALQRLYAQVTPKPVQLAEGAASDNGIKSPILQWHQTGTCHCFVLEKAGAIKGCVHIVYHQGGFWVQLWVDMQNNDTENMHQLLRYAFTFIRKTSTKKPIYVGVRDYHGGLSTLLSDYGFVPFSDRARMVKHVMQFVRKVAPSQMPALEQLGKVVPNILGTSHTANQGQPREEKPTFLVHNGVNKPIVKRLSYPLSHG